MIRLLKIIGWMLFSFYIFFNLFLGMFGYERGNKVVAFYAGVAIIYFVIVRFVKRRKKKVNNL